MIRLALTAKNKNVGEKSTSAKTGSLSYLGYMCTKTPKTVQFASEVGQTKRKTYCPSCLEGRWCQLIAKCCCRYLGYYWQVRCQGCFLLQNSIFPYLHPADFDATLEVCEPTASIHLLSGQPIATKFDTVYKTFQVGKINSYFSEFINPNSSIVITHSKIHSRLRPLDTI